MPALEAAAAAPPFARSLSLQPPSMDSTGPDGGDRPSGAFTQPDASTSQLSSIATSQTSARSRTRSVGADGRFYASACTPLHALGRGPGTPDIMLAPAKDARASPVAEARQWSRTRSSSDVHKAALPGRPRLTTQLRSFLSSLGASSSAHTPTMRTTDESTTSVGPKARSSSEYGRPKPSTLMMPSARLAGLDGLHGLNADSPPLTPASDEAGHADSDDYLARHHLRHHWAAAQALAEGAQTSAPRSASVAVSTASDCTSPAFSTFSHASSIASSSMALDTCHYPSMSLLPSHAVSPTTSPSPEQLAPKWRAGAHWPGSLLSSRLGMRLSTPRMPRLRPHLPALLFLMTAFIGSTMCILLALSTLPLHLPGHITDLTISEIRDMSMHLKAYSRSSPKAFAHTLAVLSAFFTWKQSFTVPGSIIMNVVFGAMYGTWMGTLYTSLLTSLGGIFCYLLVAPLGPLIRALPGLNRALERMQRAMPDRSTAAKAQTDKRRAKAHGAGGNIWSYLLVLRVLPVVPYGLMNIACSVLRIPLLPYAVTLAIGSIPWNACTVQIGDLLVQVVSALDDSTVPTAFVSLDSGGFHDAPLSTSTTTLAAQKAAAAAGRGQSGARAIAARVWNREMMLKLVLMSVVSLAPMLLQRWLKRRSTALDEEDATHDDQETAAVAAAMASQHPQSPRQPARSSWSGLGTPQRHTSHSKRFSDAWTGTGERVPAAMSQMDLEGRTYPSLKRAVADGRVD